jgi:hypothetical protein
MAFSKITGKHAASNLKYAVSGRLAVQASDIHPPYVNYLTGSRDFADSQPVKVSIPFFLINKKNFLLQIFPRGFSTQTIHFKSIGMDLRFGRKV